MKQKRSLNKRESLKHFRKYHTIKKGFSPVKVSLIFPYLNDMKTLDWTFTIDKQIGFCFIFQINIISYVNLFFIFSLKINISAFAFIITMPYKKLEENHNPKPITNNLSA